LQRQHLTSIQFLTSLCAAVLDGAYVRTPRRFLSPASHPSLTLSFLFFFFFFPRGIQLNSSELSFHPRKLPDAGSAYEVDCQSAGSTALMIQASLPALLFASGECCVTIRGGTNATMAPPLDYIVHVFSPVARRAFDLDAGIEITKRCVPPPFFPFFFFFCWGVCEQNPSLT
jgi:RNA 3'-terminal phosphate cyclase